MPFRNSRQPANGGHHASRIGRLAAKGKKLCALARRAQTAIEDTVGMNTCPFQLPAIRRWQVQFPFARRGRLPFRKQREKLFGNLLPHFVATASDTRAEGRVDVGGIRTEFVCHLVDCSLCHFAGGSAPSGVNSRNTPLSAVEQQNGHAIRGPHANAFPDVVRDESVAFALPVFQSIRVENDARMNLFQRDIGLRIALASAKSVSLPDKFLKRIAAVDAVASEAE